MKKLLAIIILTLLVYSIKSQVVVDTSFKLPVPEKLHYDIYYKLGKLWIKAGLANFSTDTTIIDSTKVYQFTAEGYSMKKYDWVYKLEDHYKSVTDFKTLYPIRFEKENIEQGDWVHVVYNFNRSAGLMKSFREESHNDPEHKTEKLSGFITDALSSVYYLRKWDFSRLNIGDTIKFNTILDGKIFKQPIIYLGNDTINSVNSTKVPMLKLGAVISNSTFFRKDGLVTVWLTNDRYRRMAKVKADIVVGSIFVYLNKRGLESFGPE